MSLRNYRTIADLPNELLVQVFQHLDRAPPSASQDALLCEPRLNLTSSDKKVLKTTSLVSKRWRAATLPILYRHMQLKPSSPEIPPLLAVQQVQSFLGFIKRHSLQRYTTSFTLTCATKNFRVSHGQELISFFRGFWGLLFEVLDPIVVTIVADVESLSFFTGCAIGPEQLDWFDAPCHYLQLSRAPKTEMSEALGEEESRRQHAVPTTLSKPLHHHVFSDESHTQSIPGTPGVSKSEPEPMLVDGECHSRTDEYADGSVLFSHPWTKLLLNEGSYLKVYGSTEYWERQTPSILPELLGTPQSSPKISSTIRDMAYIAIFPLDTHFSTIINDFPCLDQIYVQLVPRDHLTHQSPHWDDIDTENLWAERNRCYALLMRELFNSPPAGNFLHLKKFESGDAADVDAWNMAVEYVKRAGNGWRIAAEGVFERSENAFLVKPEGNIGDGMEGSAFNEGALIRWAWNGTAVLPVSARALYDRPLGPAN